MVVTWPHREKTNVEQEDFVVNLHFLWLSHLLGFRNEVIEKFILSWIQQTDIRIKYYHNDKFILFSCLKASEDFIESDFKNIFIEAIKSKNIYIPNSFNDLRFSSGIFRHIGKDVFFHFFNPGSELSDEITENDLKNYYKFKNRKGFKFLTKMVDFSYSTK